MTRLAAPCASESGVLLEWQQLALISPSMYQLLASGGEAKQTLEDPNLLKTRGAPPKGGRKNGAAWKLPKSVEIENLFDIF